MNPSAALADFLRDPRLTPYATSGLPVWLWSTDAARLLWANPTGAAIFNASSPAALIGRAIAADGTAARQIARIAGTLAHGAAPRLERLHGFGGRFGQALMCTCSRVTLADRTGGILVAAIEPAGPKLPLPERCRRLLVGIDEPVALFGADGNLLDATASGRQRMIELRSLHALGIERVAGDAMTGGRAQGPSHVGPVAVERIGSGVDTVLVVTFVGPAASAAPAVELQPRSTPTTEATAPRHDAGPARRQSLRFGWQMGTIGGFTIESGEFSTLLDPTIVAALERSWSDAAEAWNLDPSGQLARAFASRETWSGITVEFPARGTSERLPVELSGLPIFDRERRFLGYRGFGICRRSARMTVPMQMRRGEPPTSTEPGAGPRHEPPPLHDERPTLSASAAAENVVPFRSAAPDKQPTLTPVERRAFRELATRLTERLRSVDGESRPPPLGDEATVVLPDLAATTAQQTTAAAPQPPRIAELWPLLDRMPVGVLVYRLDRLIYANRAFLDWTQYTSIEELSAAGGINALFVEPSGDSLGDENAARPLAIATKGGEALAVEARLFSSPWDGESALVLMMTRAVGTGHRSEDDAKLRAAQDEARELNAIVNAAADAIVVLDRQGLVVAVNRSATVMFGLDSRDMIGLPVTSLVAPESQRAVFDSFDGAHRAGNGRPAAGCEVIGRTRQGRTLPLSLTVVRMTDGSDKFIAFFRDITAWKKAEEDLLNARHRAEMASSAKSDFLAKISHEIRTPLNAIIGFSEVMMAERFGPIGNDRYRQYLKDIHTSGEHLISLLNDLIDLSKIEAGRLDLNFTSVDLNELTLQCVALMQPQASRERVIIRTSLTPTLPPVVADARSVRQIVLNLLSNSIKFTGAGGQVIISTAMNDSGEVALRVRDTGIGMSEKDIAVALEPFRQLATSGRAGSGGGLGLPLTKALAEANRASFRIRSAVNAGTLVEVAFPGARMAAE